MNKNLIIISTVLIIVAVIGFFLLSQNNTNRSSVVSDLNTENKMTTGGKMDENMSHGSYVEYSKEQLEKSADNRRVLFFFASWCPTCRPTDVNISSNLDKIPQDLTIIRVNYNDPETDEEEKELARKYGITYQHTFVQIDSAGAEIAKWNGGQLNELLANIK